MSVDSVGAAVLVAVLILPIVTQLYLYRLPVAPACPTCRATTRPRQEWLLLRWVPALGATSLGECTECGWRGRMRWRWATRTASRRQG